VNRPIPAGVCFFKVQKLRVELVVFLVGNERLPAAVIRGIVRFIFFSARLRAVRYQTFLFPIGPSNTSCAAPDDPGILAASRPHEFAMITAAGQGITGNIFPGRVDNGRSGVHHSAAEYDAVRSKGVYYNAHDPGKFFTDHFIDLQAAASRNFT